MLVALSACGSDSTRGGEPTNGVASHQETLFVNLMKACASGDLAAVQEIINGPGADLVNATTPATFDTPLLRATELGHAEIVEFLLSRGAKPDPQSIGQNTPLMQASYNGNARIVSALLAAGANPNVSEERYGDSPLLFAAWKGHANVVEQLLSAGAAVNYRAKDGRSALKLAVQGHHENVEAILRQHGAAE